MTKGDLIVMGGVQRRKDLMSEEMGDLGDIFGNLGDILGGMGMGNLGGGMTAAWLGSCACEVALATRSLRAVAKARVRSGPIPSIQWYSSAKQPPGQRRTGTLIFFNASTTSLRIPRVLGMELSSPTQ